MYSVSAVYACGIDNCVNSCMSKPALLLFVIACPQPICKDLYMYLAVSHGPTISARVSPRESMYLAFIGIIIL